MSSNISIQLFLFWTSPMRSYRKITRLYLYIFKECILLCYCTKLLLKLFLSQHNKHWTHNNKFIAQWSVLEFRCLLCCCAIMSLLHCWTVKCVCVWDSMFVVLLCNNEFIALLNSEVCVCVWDSMFVVLLCNNEFIALLHSEVC
jgi:hypothetical protein